MRISSVYRKQKSLVRLFCKEFSLLSFVTETCLAFVLLCFCSALRLLCSAFVLLCFCSTLLSFCSAFVLLCFHSALLSFCFAVVLLCFTFCHYHKGVAVSEATVHFVAWSPLGLCQLSVRRSENWIPDICSFYFACEYSNLT